MNKGLHRWLATAALPLLAWPGLAAAQTAAPDAAAAATAEPGEGRGLIRTFAAEDDAGSGSGLIRTFAAEDEAGRPVVAMGGDLKRVIDPKIGLIRTFAGDLSPYIGLIRTFEGDLDPSRGLIRTFEGDLDPFRGLIRTFWGSLTPQLGDLDPKIGLIRTFSDGFVTQSRDTLAFWQTVRPYATAPADSTALAARLSQMVQDGEATWGSKYTAATGKTFQAGFVAPFLARHGVNLASPTMLAGWTAEQRSTFMLEWYDTLLNYSGMDRADHWMNAINWTPKLTQTQGGGVGTTIGLVDFFVANDADVKSKITYSGGYTSTNNPHGAAVVSLIVASHDGRGIMGIAPNASVAAYNPFDATQTASWTDVQAGIAAVGARGASVINLSLGVGGWTLNSGWRDVLKAVDTLKDKSIFVIAAGNDGISQTAHVNMKDAFDTTFLVVGSVDPNGVISSFSNRPGTACLLDDRDCKNTQVWNTGNGKFLNTDYLKESGLLMNRFLVAPGEMILVSDGAGGVTRMSGTSFAAPLVAGAIALIHDRWPWRKKYPRDVAKSLLESAQDLGAPGVDPVYGHGLLDIEAAQSVLNFNALKYYLVSKDRGTEVKLTTLQSTGLQSSWAANDLFFSAFEKLDNTERDFLIPLSTRLFGTQRNGEYFQEFVYHRFMAWMSGASFAPTAGYGFTDSARTGTAALNPDGWTFAMRGRREQVSAAQNSRTLKLHSSVELTAPGGAMSFAVGSGDGAALLGGQGSLQMSSDFDARDGGANPLLGFASGGGHAAGRVTVARGLNVTVGATYQDRAIDRDLGGVAGSDRLLVQSLDPYRASATTVRVDYRPATRLGLSAAYTRLDENRAFLGVRSLDRNDFGRSAVSDGMTLSADLNLGAGLSMFGSATASTSHTGGGAAMQVRGVRATAFQAGFAKARLLGTSDQLRLTIAQPLTVERGFIDLSTVAVIDRETGAKGVVTQRFDIGAPERRRYVAEALYGAALFDGRAQLSVFGRGELRQVDPTAPNLILGGSLGYRF